ncbi:hypothetical protein P8452_52756 [Trifolium repens]|nr:hypothetical protein P8452_52756 [Trifolium repens]
MESNATPHEDEDEYVLLDLDGVYGLIDIPPNSNYVLTVGEYEETIGTCITFSEQDTPVVHEETGPSETNQPNFWNKTNRFKSTFDKTSQTCVSAS